MKYMLLTYSPRDFDFQNFSTDRPEWVGEMIAFMHQLNEDLQASGELVAAEGLADRAETRTVRLVGDEAVTTDGPYAETKEVLAGFWIVEVPHLERAAEIAARVVRFVRQAIEIRPIGEAPSV